MGVQNKNQGIDLENIKIVIRFSDRDFSRYTLFVPLFKFSKTFLGLEDKLSRFLQLKYKSKQYPVPKIANAVTNLICCGVDRFTRMNDEFKIETGLAKSLGFPNGFFSASTVSRFFQSFNGYNINQLERINLEILKEKIDIWLPKTGSIFIDLDMNTKSVEGKKIEKATLGYNRKSPGRLCLNWSVAHIAKIALFSDLHTGKASGRTILKNQILYLEKLIKKLGVKSEDTRIVFRIDGGYFSWDNLKFLGSIRFLTRLPNNLKVFKPYRKRKHKWKKYTKASEYTDLGILNFPDANIKLRVVLVRIFRKKKTLYYPLCTNLKDWEARSIVKAYRGRQIVENCFRDTNQAFFSNKLPSSSFNGNKAFLWFIVMAYNIFFFFQRENIR